MGLDIGTAAVKAVVLSPGRRRPRLAAAGIEPVRTDGTNDGPFQNDHGVVVEALGKLLESLRLEPQQVARLTTSVGGPNVSVAEFDMPQMSPRELRRAIPWEARKHLPDEGRVFDYEILDSRGQERARVMLASVPQIQLEEHLSVLSAVGLAPERVEATPIALSLACRGLMRGASPQACLLLDIGASGTTLVIGEEAGPFFCRSLDVSVGAPSLELALPDGSASEAPEGAGDPVLVQQARQGEGPLLEELVLEVRRSMVFFGSHFVANTIERVVLTGGGGMSDVLAETLAGQLGIPVTRFAYRGNDAVPRLDAQHAVAYGLAARLGR